MSLRNCFSCGTLFSAPHPGVRLCATCEKEEQNRFDMVKTYIKDNPGATALKIMKDTGIERKELYDWVRTGRIEVAGMDGLGLACESCGTSISTGRLCTDCGLRIQQEARNALGGQSPGAKKDKTTEKRGGGGFHVHSSVLRRRGRD